MVTERLNFENFEPQYLEVESSSDGQKAYQATIINSRRCLQFKTDVVLKANNFPYMKQIKLYILLMLIMITILPQLFILIICIYSKKFS